MDVKTAWGSAARVAATLGVIVTVTAALRLWRVTESPEWLDEAMTALVAAGRGPDAFPMERVVPLSAVADVFDPAVSASLGDVFRVFTDPRVQDLHPPAFHLLSNLALRSGVAARWPLVARVRLLAILFGIAAVAATYWAAREAFEPRVALTAAAIAGTSPYAVMLSREARNYSYAMLIATLATGVTLAIAKRIDDGRRAPPGWWTLWAVAASAGLYAHYFVVFAWAAHVALLALVAIERRARAALVGLAVSSAAVVASFVPWTPVLIAHIRSPEQDWLTFAQKGGIARMPYAIASVWQNMMVGKAWDGPEPVYMASRAIALIIFLWLGTIVVLAFRRSSYDVSADRASRRLFAAIGLSLAAFGIAMALLGRNFAGEPRYHVVYYPMAAIVVAWALAKRPRALAVLLTYCAVSSVMVDYDVESWKGIDAAPVVERLGNTAQPSLIVAGVDSFNQLITESVFLRDLLAAHGSNGRSIVFTRRPLSEAIGALRLDALPASVLVHRYGLPATDYPESLILEGQQGLRATCEGVAMDASARQDDTLPIRAAYRSYRCD